MNENLTLIDLLINKMAIDINSLLIMDKIIQNEILDAEHTYAKKTQVDSHPVFNSKEIPRICHKSEIFIDVSDDKKAHLALSPMQIVGQKRTWTDFHHKGVMALVDT